MRREGEALLDSDSTGTAPSYSARGGGAIPGRHSAWPDLARVLRALALMGLVICTFGLLAACGADKHTLSDGSTIEIAGNFWWYVKMAAMVGVCFLLVCVAFEMGEEGGAIAAVVVVAAFVGLTYFWAPGWTKPSTKSVETAEAAIRAAGPASPLDTARQERDELKTRLKSKVTPYIRKMESRLAEQVDKFRRSKPTLVRLNITTHEDMTKAVARARATVHGDQSRDDFLELGKINKTLENVALFERTVERFKTLRFNARADLQDLEHQITRLETLDESAAIDPDASRKLAQAVQRAKKAATQTLTPLGVENVANRSAAIFKKEMSTAVKAESEP